jgi:hypothetical protein
LQDTIAGSIEDYPSTATYLESRDFVNYTEDIFVGYRYFETFAPEKVLYPFGFGLSYTSFAVSREYAALEKNTVKLTVRVKGIHTAQEDIHQLPKFHLSGIIVNADGLPVPGALIFHIQVIGVLFLTAGEAADHIGHTGEFPERGCDAPEASAGKICCFFLIHKITTGSIISNSFPRRKMSDKTQQRFGKFFLAWAHKI